MHQFSRSQGTPFRCRFSFYSWRNGAAKMFAYHLDVSSRLSKDCVNTVLPSRLKLISTCTQRFINAPFSRLHRSSFRCCFGYYSWRNGAAIMLAQQLDVILWLSKDCVNPFLVFNVKFSSTPAQRGQFCTIFRSVNPLFLPPHGFTWDQMGWGERWIARWPHPTVW